jgi:hypothetical protein
MHSGTSRAWNINTLLFMLRWAQRGSHKKHVGTCHAKLVFLHPVWSTCHVVRFCCVRGTKHQNTIFMLGWAQCEYHKKSTLWHVTPNLCLCIWCDLWVALWVLVRPGHKTLMHYLSYSCGPSADLTKSTPGHVTTDLCFCIQVDLWE